MNCYHCGAAVDSGLALCDLCQHKVRTDLQYLPVYFANLARWKPGRAGGRPVPGSRIPKGVLPPTEDRMALLVDEAEVGMVGWADCLADDRPGHLARVVARILAMEGPARYRLLCQLFDRHLTSVATLGWCGEFVRSIMLAETALRERTEEVVPGWYAGACRGVGGVPCGANTYVVPGLTWVTCRRCGVTTAARDHLPVILDEAGAWVARPKALAETVVALVETEQSVPKLVTRIRQWAHQGHLHPVYRMARGHVFDSDAERIVVADVEVGHARYRLGEVLDLARRDTHRLKMGRAS